MTFSGDVDAFLAKVKARYELAARKIAIDVFSEVILMSPVDTGRFRGNWQCAVGEVPKGTLQLDDKSGTATISAVEAKTLGLAAGQIIYLVNNLPYSQALEYGSSKQAPNGMVRLTVQRYEKIVAKVSREISRMHE